MTKKAALQSDLLINGAKLFRVSKSIFTEMSKMD